jgi:hypothetical protein
MNVSHNQGQVIGDAGLVQRVVGDGVFRRVEEDFILTQTLAALEKGQVGEDFDMHVGVKLRQFVPSGSYLGDVEVWAGVNDLPLETGKGDDRAIYDADAPYPSTSQVERSSRTYRPRANKQRCAVQKSCLSLPAYFGQDYVSRVAIYLLVGEVHLRPACASMRFTVVQLP